MSVEVTVGEGINAVTMGVRRRTGAEEGERCNAEALYRGLAEAEQAV